MVTAITNEAGQTDYPYYWTSTTHGSAPPIPTLIGEGVYVSFGRALGYDGQRRIWTDVHGAGAQRSDPKDGDPANYPNGRGPQGDAIRIFNYVRLVRTVLPTDDSIGDGIPNVWRAQYFGGSGGGPDKLHRHLVCVQRTGGSILWDKPVPAELPEDPFTGSLTEHGYASSTPVTDGERVYVFFGKTGVLAFDFEGRPLWKVNVGKQSANRR